MGKIFKKSWVKNEEVIDPVEEVKEEKKMELDKYKDKLIIGVLAGVASIVAATLIANKIRSSDFDEFDEDDEDLELVDQDIASEFDSEKVVNF